MAADKKPCVFEAYAFQDLPIEKLVLKKPNLVTKSDIAELKDSIRTAPFVNLTPSKGEWLRVCFDVDPEHASTLRDDKGVPQCFKLVIDVDGDQEAFMAEPYFHQMQMSIGFPCSWRRQSVPPVLR